MRLLIVSQYFWPETFRINEIATSLAKTDIKVTVLTAKPNYPEGVVYPGYQAFGCQHEIYGKVMVKRLPLLPRGSKNRLRLAANYLSFIVSGLIFGPAQVWGSKFDAVLVYSPSPLLQAIPAILLKWLKRAPLILYVQDLWPQSLEATGYVRAKWILRAVGYLVRHIYRNAELILVSSRPFIPAIQAFRPNCEIVYLPNSVQESGALTQVHIQMDREQWSVPQNAFSVMFAGNIGAAQAVGVIISAADALREYPQIHFVVVGSGSELNFMKSECTARGLANIHFPGRFPSEAMPALFTEASVLLATLADRPIFAGTVPNKIQAYLKAAKPVIASMNGEGAKIVTEAGAGFATPAEDGPALAEAILKLYQMTPQQRAAMGKRGHEYFDQYFDHEKLITSLVDHLNATVDRHRAQK